MIIIRAIIVILLLCSYGWAFDRVGYWNMDEASGNLIDQSGQGNNCTANGSPDYSQAGPLNRGTAIGFDGSTDWFNCGDNGSLDFGTGNFTIAFWLVVPFTGSNPYYNGIIVKGENSTAIAHTWYFCQYSNTVNRIGFYDSIDAGGSFNAQMQSPVLSQGWNEIVCTRNGTLYSLFVNGSVVATQTKIVVDLNNSANFQIGKEVSNRYINSILDDIKVYNYALSAIQIQHEYQQSRLAISRKHEPWKWIDLFKLAFNFRGDQLYEKDNRISYLRQHPIN